MNGLSPGSVLAPIVFNVFTNDLSPTKSRRFGYADEIYCGTKASTFTEQYPHNNMGIVMGKKISLFLGSYNNILKTGFYESLLLRELRGKVRFDP